MRIFLLLTSCLLIGLAGCGSSNSAPSTSTKTQVETRPHVDSLEFVGGRTITPMMVEVDSNVKMKVIATGADEVDLVMSENGQDTPTVIAKLPNPNPSQKNEKQTYVYEWVPSAENYGGFFWAIAKNKDDKSESGQIHVKIMKNP